MIQKYSLIAIIIFSFNATILRAEEAIEVPAQSLEVATKEFAYTVKFPDGQTKAIYQADSRWLASRLHLLTPARFDAKGAIQLPGNTMLIVKNNTIIRKEKDILSKGVPEGCYVIVGRKTIGDYLNKFKVGDRVLVFHDKPFPELYFKITIDDENVLRKDEQLIAYDANWGVSTRANNWGMEVTLRKGRVIDMQYAGDSPIVDGDIVLSGHGYGRWVLDSGIFPGLKFQRRARTIIFSANAQSYIDYCQWYLSHAKKLLQTPDAKDFNPNARQWTAHAGDLLEKSKAMLNEEKFQEAWNAWRQAFELARKAYYACSFASRPDDVRGLWISRPPMNDYKGRQLCWLLDQKLFNWVILPVEPNSGNEPVKSLSINFIKFCHSRGIKVSLWTWLPTRFFTPDPAATNPLPVIDARNEKQISEMIELAVKFVKEFDADGLTFDFEGYKPESKDMLFSFIKTLPSKSRAEFLNEIETGQINSYKPAYWAWARYRERLLRKIVARATKKLREVKPDIKLSLCPEAGDTGYLRPIAMLWPEWVNDGFFDEVTPQHYHFTPVAVGNRVQTLNSYFRNAAPQVASLLLYTDTSKCGSYAFEPLLIMQNIRAARNAGAKGVYFFVSSWLQWGKTDEIVEALKVGPFRMEEATSKQASMNKTAN